MASVYEIADDFSRRVNRREEAARARIAAIYLRLADSARDGLVRVLERMAEAGELTPAALYRRERWERLLASVLALHDRAAALAAREISGAKARGIELGSAQAERAIASVDGMFTRPPLEALERQIAFLADGSPLRETLASLGPLAASRMEDALLSGLAEGRNPREIARLASQAGDMARPRAQTIARTETLRSYRSAAIENYQANADVVQGWVWLAALDADTCPVCWAMHGTVHPAREEFGSHPNCRCSPAPLVDGQERPEAGPAQFASLPEEEQLKVLGPQSFDLYRQGRLELADLVGYRDDPDWGPSRYRLPLKDIEGARSAA